MLRTKFDMALLVAMLLLSRPSHSAKRRRTPRRQAPLPTTSSEYKLPATIDPQVTPLIATELWARIYRPTDLNSGPYPVLIFLHGNHAPRVVASRGPSRTVRYQHPIYIHWNLSPRLRGGAQSRRLRLFR